MNRILLVEDSAEIQILVAAAFKRKYDLVSATTLKEAESLMSLTPFDLVLLDITLPDGDGYQFCTLLQNDRATKDIPIIFLTARDDVSDKILGFSLGADDYIVKPFDPAQLRARIDSKIRSLMNKRQSGEIITHGNLQIDVLSRQVRISQNDETKTLELTPIEYKLLLSFVRHADQVMTRNTLLSSIWGDELHISDRSIDAHVSKLRRKLSPHADYIQPVYGSGYVFSVNPPSISSLDQPLMH
jgi:two-component system phosphate regulon response regulator PhoB